MVSTSIGNQLQYLHTATGVAVNLKISTRNGSHTVKLHSGFEPSKVKHVERRNVICAYCSGVNIMINSLWMKISLIENKSNLLGS